MFDFSTSLRQAFGRPSRASKRVRGPRRALSLTVERLEDRAVPAITNLVATAPAVAQEGQSVPANQTLLTFVDDVGPAQLPFLSATISWGDGSQDVVTGVSVSPARIVHTGVVTSSTYAVVASPTNTHFYAEEIPVGGVFTVQITDSSDAATGQASAASSP